MSVEGYRAAASVAEKERQPGRPRRVAFRERVGPRARAADGLAATRAASL